MLSLLSPLLRKRSLWNARRQKTQRNNIGFEQARHIGLIYESPELSKMQYSREFLAVFKNHTIQVDPFIVIKNKKAIKQFNLKPEETVGFHDLGTLGGVDSQHVEDFLNRKFDYILYLGEKRQVLADYLLTLSKARCRVGPYSEEGQHFFEFMIKSPAKEGPKGLMDQMYYYLIKIKADAKPV